MIKNVPTKTKVNALVDNLFYIMKNWLNEGKKHHLKIFVPFKTHGIQSQHSKIHPEGFTQVFWDIV